MILRQSPSRAARRQSTPVASHPSWQLAAGLVLMAAVLPVAASADDLYQGQSFAALASDRVASSVGDSLTVVVIQVAEARNSATASSNAAYDLGASIEAGSTDEGLSINFGRDEGRRGEVRRSQSFTTQIAVTVVELAPNGDLIIAGEQRMTVNGQATTLRVTGRVRPADLQADNRVASNRVVDARIDFDSEERLDEGRRASLLSWLTDWFRGIL